MAPVPPKVLRTRLAVLLVTTLVVASGLLMATTTPGVIPDTLHELITGGRIEAVVRVRVVELQNQSYSLPDSGNRTREIPVTAALVEIQEVFKERSQHALRRKEVFMHTGLSETPDITASQSAQVDAQWKGLKAGGEFVVLATANQLGEWWCSSPAGVFYPEGGKVRTLVPSPLGTAWSGKPWTAFLAALKREATQAGRGSRR